MRRIPSLDGLRAVAILMVCLSHFAQTKGSPLHNFSSFGNFGVRIFFVISGMLITRLLLEERKRYGAISLKNFYYRRVLRIFPAMWFYMAVILALQAASILRLQPKDALHAFTYTVNYSQQRSWYIGHLWSLSVEEQFYLLWPMAIVFGGIRWGRRIAIAAIVAAPLLRLVAMLAMPGAPITEWFPTTCDALATGCLLALLNEDELRRLSVSPLLFAVSCFLPIFINSLQYHVPSRYFVVFGTLGQTAMNCFIAAAVYYLVQNPGGFSGRLLNSRPLVWVGLISYSLYLWQQPFLNMEVSSWITAFPVNLLAAFLAAAVSYYLVETPILNLRKRLSSAPAVTHDRAPVMAKSVATPVTEV
jgi:peptidoglycan/LPS O-acetylase OafA/YrhL